MHNNLDIFNGNGYQIVLITKFPRTVDSLRHVHFVSVYRFLTFLHISFVFLLELQRAFYGR